LVAIQQGKVYATGTPEQVMTEETVRDVFNLECRIVNDPLADTPMCIPIGRKVRRGKDAKATAKLREQN
jgi:iron complex transport system ATP-binding protein